MKKIFFIITLIAVLLGVFFLLLIISNLRQPSSEVIVETPTPTQTQARPTYIPPPIIEEEPLLEQLIDRLPVSTDKYDIEYLSSSNTFIVTIKESPFSENSQEALSWFTQNGFSNTDNLNIIYNSYEWVE